MSAHLVATVLALVGCFMLLCRVDKMLKGHTYSVVFYQHASLALSIFTSMVLEYTDLQDWSPAVINAGVVVFLVLSLPRWKRGAPSGTNRPAPLSDDDLHHVVGGKRDKETPCSRLDT